ncbi:MAG TPA: acetyl-CoA carboxylase biotin carboxyl carrier protein subunit [Prolixibacteraceae bacterium]|nr:acetyl-CoA carboxylase biotin carboxyl carrier protein subunit [Prolixibacteraceae bacterium]
MEHNDENFYGEYPTLSISSGKYRTELTQKFRNRKVWVTHDPKKIQSVIPGTVIDVLVKNGQKVKKGETLMILESMKMQNQILMPFDGKIKRVNVKSDEVIPKNHLMIELA